MRYSFYLISLAFLSATLSAEPSDFNTGPVFERYGENAVVSNGLANPEQQRFKIAFDIYKKNEGSGANRSFNSLARFINMHVRAGVPPENIDVAMVVHGEASKELMNSTAYSKRFDQPNRSEALIKALLDSGVSIQLCGQSARFHNVAEADLIKGVKMSLSAMTSHALLQQAGYSLNPF